MPILGTLLTTLFGNLVEYFMRWMSKKVAIGAAAVAVFGGLTLVLWAAIGAALMGLVVSLPDDSAVLMGLWVAVPSNAQGCLSATIAADTAIALYKWNRENLRLMAYIT